MKTMVTKTTTSGYSSLGKNMYQISTAVGNRYRVRVSVNGTQYDQYFTSKTKATKFRNDLLKRKTA